MSYIDPVTGVITGRKYIEPIEEPEILIGKPVEPRVQLPREVEPMGKLGVLASLFYNKNSFPKIKIIPISLVIISGYFVYKKYIKK